MPPRTLRRPRACPVLELQRDLLTEPDRPGDGAPSRHDVLDEAVDWERLTPRGAWYTLGRPVLDELLLALCLPFALVLGLAVALASAVAFGSWRDVLFIQPRVGQRGRVFRLVKFRTMREAHGSAFESWAAGDPARVTPYGRFLRSTHLDELPQFLNILRGEMSFIGPRPEMVEVEEWANANVPGFVERLAIKPGITGLAQVTQGYTPRDVAAYRRKLEINRRYLARLSLAADLAILGRTVLWMVRGRGWKWRSGATGT